MTIKETYLPLFLLDGIDILLSDLKISLKSESKYKQEVKQTLNRMYFNFQIRHKDVLKLIAKTNYAEQFGEVTDDFLEYTELNNYNNSTEIINNMFISIYALRYYNFEHLDTEFINGLISNANRLMVLLKPGIIDTESVKNTITKIDNFKLWKDVDNPTDQSARISSDDIN